MVTVDARPTVALDEPSTQTRCRKVVATDAGMNRLRIA
jgi:hypothetical protein